MSIKTTVIAAGTGLLIGIGAVAGLGAVVSPQKPSGGTTTHTSPIQAYSAPLRAVKKTLQRDGFTVSSTLNIPACKTEDSHDCIWLADKSGNGVGESFIDYHGHVYYIDHAYDY